MPRAKLPPPPVAGSPSDFPPLIDAPELHLRNAKVDEDGDIYATGRMTLPPDPGGLFPLVASDQLKLHAEHPAWLTLTPSVVERDETTRFLSSTAAGPALQLPPLIGRLINEALKWGAKNPVHVTLDDGGVLRAKGEDYKNANQHLSDWRIEICEVESVLTVRLSAALRAVQPAEPRHTFEHTREDFWPGDEPPRLSVELSVDPLTQAARYGKYSKLLTSDTHPEPTRSPRTHLGALRLEHAPIGVFLHTIYGVSDEGYWEAFFASENTILFHGGGFPKRRLDGLMADWGNIWPRYWFWGVDMETVEKLTKSSPSVTITLSDGWFGEVEFSGGPEPTKARMVKGELSFEVTLDGLVVSYRALFSDPYRVKPPEPEWHGGKLTLPWEVLILRYPHFLRHRKKILDRKTD